MADLVDIALLVGRALASGSFVDQSLNGVWRFRAFIHAQNRQYGPGRLRLSMIGLICWSADRCCHGISR